MNQPDPNQAITATERDTLHAARAKRDRCVCGELHDDDDYITPATIARMKAYLALHPGRQFVVDEDVGLIAVIVVPAPNASGPLQIIAQSRDLPDLLTRIGAPPAETMS